jgi:hypothetical protein
MSDRSQQCVSQSGLGLSTLTFTGSWHLGAFGQRSDHAATVYRAKQASMDSGTRRVTSSVAAISLELSA